MAAKILVVDDYTTTRNALSFSLRQEGYQVVAVVNGTEAVNRLAIESFDLVLSDFSMPGMDGLALTRHISRFAPQIPIIIMSGSIEISRQDAVNAGAFDFIEKPFEIHSLIAKIELAFAIGPSSSTAQPSFDKSPQFIS
jgi:CheY-like chemotaxis protein